MRIIRASYKIALFIIWTLVLVPLQLLYAFAQKLCGIKPRKQSPFVRLWYGIVVQILGIRIHYTPTALNYQQQYLYVSNHTSYLDIMVLGALLPPFFVAKADTADWPIFGFLVKLGGTIFISRKRSLVRQQMALFKAELQQGKNLLLFPEGTTSSGCEILPFKSSLLNVLYEDDMPIIEVVPICINYLKLNGQSFTFNTDKELVAWYRDMELLPHLWEVFQMKSIDVKVTMLAPLKIQSYDDAKKLTAHCEEIIEQAFAVDVPKRFDNPVE